MATFSLLERRNDPLWLAIFILIATLLVMSAAWGLAAAGFVKQDKLLYWNIGTSLLLLFGIINSLLSLRADSFRRYWGRSMYGFIGLAFLNALAARGFSGVPIEEAGSYKWLYVVVTFGFLVFISMVNFMKVIVGFAEREEWNEPRQRNRK